MTVTFKTGLSQVGYEDGRRMKIAQDYIQPGPDISGVEPLDFATVKLLSAITEVCPCI